ncbi:hypothetical protein MTP99_005609 [Tenebrio molitor]|nr:hypothetical protein MTP99_005609 [Tenebrio molitor]
MPFGLDNAPEALKFWVSFLWFPGREMSVPTDSPVSRRSNLGRSEEFLFGEGSIVIGPRTMAASPLTIRRSVLLECPYIAFYYGGERAHSGVRSSAACDVPVRYVLQTLSHQCVSNVDGVSRSVAAVYDNPKEPKQKAKFFPKDQNAPPHHGSGHGLVRPAAAAATPREAAGPEPGRRSPETVPCDVTGGGGGSAPPDARAVIEAGPLLRRRFRFTPSDHATERSAAEVVRYLAEMGRCRRPPVAAGRGARARSRAVDARATFTSPIALIIFFFYPKRKTQPSNGVIIKNDR